MILTWRYIVFWSYVIFGDDDKQLPQGYILLLITILINKKWYCFFETHVILLLWRRWLNPI